MPARREPHLSAEDLLLVAERMEKSRAPSTGAASFYSPAFENLVYLLAGCYDIKEVPSEVDRFRICHQGSLTAGENKPVTAQMLVRQLGRERATLLQYPSRQYLLVSTVSVAIPSDFRSRRVAGWDIRYEERLPPEMDRSSGGDSQYQKLEPLIPKGQWIIASGSSKTDHEAVDAALEAIDLLRGIWTLAHPTAVWGTLGFGPVRPMNPILLGPVHTLHHPDGKRTSSQFWYEPNYPWWGPLPWTLQNWDVAAELERELWSCIDRSTIGKWVQKLVLRYCRALDINDPELAFLQFWGLLEELTGTQSVNNEVTVRRASNFYTESDRLEYLMVDLLRHQRNRSVHAGVTSPYRRQGLDILHGYAAAMLRFILKIHSDLDSPQDFFSLLELPRDQDKLQRQIEFRKLVSRWRGFTQPQQSQQREVGQRDPECS